MGVGWLTTIPELARNIINPHLRLLAPVGPSVRLQVRRYKRISMAQILEDVKGILARIGGRLSPRCIYVVESVLNYLLIGQWMKVQGFQSAATFNTRNEAFRLAAHRIADRRVLYLEFGVWKGDSMRYWSGLLTNPDSMLHGFDSFEGLPENWSSAYNKGAFSAEGNVPVIEDSRVRFYKGWFEDTLPSYQLPPHDVMFVNCDADLYSSTKSVLSYVGPHIKPGDFLYFDEFHHWADERRAFEEFLAYSGFRFSLVGCSASNAQVLFVREPVVSSSCAKAYGSAPIGCRPRQVFESQLGHLPQIAIWKRLPIAVANRLGPKLVRGIP